MPGILSFGFTHLASAVSKLSAASLVTVGMSGQVSFEHTRADCFLLAIQAQKAVTKMQSGEFEGKIAGAVTLADIYGSQVNEICVRPGHISAEHAEVLKEHAERFLNYSNTTDSQNAKTPIQKTSNVHLKK